MTVKLGSLAANITAEREGEWVDIEEWPGLDPKKPLEQIPVPGLGFLVRSTNFPDFVTARQKALEEAKINYPNNDMPPDVAARIDGQMAVEHLLLNWRGLDVAYSPEVAAVTATAEEHRTIRSMVYWCAGRVGKRQVEFIKAAAKN